MRKQRRILALFLTVCLVAGQYQPVYAGALDITPAGETVEFKEESGTVKSEETSGGVESEETSEGMEYPPISDQKESGILEETDVISGIETESNKDPLPTAAGTKGMPASDFVVEEGVLMQYLGQDECVVIPEDLGITAIGSGAFRVDAGSGTILREVVLPEGIEEIQNSAFMYCRSLETVNFPTTLKRIGDSAFYYCESLKDARFSEGLETIGVNAFYNCSKLSALSLPEGVTKLGANAFTYCSSLKELVLPDSLQNVGSGLLYRCSGLSSVTLPGGLEGVSSEMFWGCTSLKSIQLPDSVTRIEEKAFQNASALTEVTLGEGSGLLTVAGDAFDGTAWYGNQTSGYLVLNGLLFRYKGDNAYSITIPKTVRVIGEEVFSGNTYVNTVVLQEGIVELREGAFRGCTGLRNISIPGGVNKAAPDVFQGCGNNLVIRGAEGSYIEEYAREQGITFQAFPKEFVVQNGVLTQYHGSGGEVVIPGDMGITKIGDSAFQNSGCVSVEVPEGVREIGDNAFYGCSTLKNIGLPTGLGKIGSYAFYRSGLESLEIPGSVREIGYAAFQENLNLKTAVIGEGIPYVGNSMFQSCSQLESIKLPESLEYIDNNSFSYCTSLTGIEIPGNVKRIGSSAFSGSNKMEKAVLKEGLETLEDYAFQNCGLLTKISLPDSLKSVGNAVFQGCSELTTIELPKGLTTLGGIFTGLTGITHVEIPESVKEIGNRAFSGCSNLTEVVIQEGVTTIGNYAFESCTKLEMLKLPVGLESIGDSAFASSGLKSIGLPAGVTRIATSMFSDCASLAEVTLSEQLTEIGDNAFYGCSTLKNIGLPTGLGKIGSYAFYRSGLESLEIPGSVREIGYAAFQENLNLKTVELGEGIPYVGNRMFQSCSQLESIKLPESLEYIDNSSFSYCTSLIEIEIPGNVKRIGSSAFSGCNKMEKAVLKEGLETLEDSAFQNCGLLTKISLPDSLKSVGNAVFQGCSELTTIELPKGLTTLGGIFTGLTGITRVEIPESVKEIGNRAFSGCSNLTEVVIPKGVTTIGNYAFENCTKLEMLKLPVGLESIGDSAFDSSGLKSIELPEGVTRIASSMFSNCASLAEVTLSGQLTEIGNNAFYGCSTLKNIGLPTGLGKIGSYAFYRSGLESLKIPGSVREIGYAAFQENLNLKTAVLGEGIPYVGNSMFQSCRQLESIKLPESLEYIDNNSFSYCTSLTGIEIPGNVKRIGSSAFSGCSKMEKAVLKEGLETLEDSAFRNCGLLTKISLPDSLKRVGNAVFQGCSKLSTIDLPKGLTTLGGIFTGLTGITHVEIPESVKEIGNRAFSGCSNLTEVVIPEGVTTIGSNAFESCMKLEMIKLPVGLESIGDSAFASSGLKSIGLPEGVTRIASSMFSDCASLAEVTLSAQLTEIGNNAFYGCSTLKNIGLPTGLGKIGSYAFYRSGLESLEIPGSVREIGYAAFQENRNLKTVELGEGIPYVGNSMFQSCSQLESIKLPESLEYIDNYSFSSCTSLTGIEIPGNVERIGSSAFSGCSAMTEATLAEGIQQLEGYAFYNCDALTRISLPRSLNSIASYAIYNNAPNLVIQGFRGTAAESYALNNALTFAEIDNVAPAKPDKLMLNKRTGTTVELKWEPSYDSFGEAKYIVYRDGTEVGRTDKHIWQDTKLTPGTTYSYRIVAYNIYNTTSEAAAIETATVVPEILLLQAQGGAQEVGGIKPAVLQAEVKEQQNLEGVKAEFWYRLLDQEWISLGAGTERQKAESREYTLEWPLQHLVTGSYEIKVIVTDKEGSSSEKAASIKVDRTPPEVIFGMTVRGEVSRITLSWGIAAEINTDVYHLYRRTEGEEEAVKRIAVIKGRNQLSYRDTTAEKGKGYWYSISGVDLYGQEGERSEEIYGACIEDNIPPEITGFLPESGSYLKGIEEIRITAEDNIGLEKISYFISTDEVTWIPQEEIDCKEAAKKTAVFQLDTSKLPDGKVKVKAEAVDRAGLPAKEGIRTCYVDNHAPEQVKGLSFEGTATTALLKWEITKDDVSYFLVEQKKEEENFVNIGTVKGTNGMNLSGLLPNTAYSYRVAGVDRAGNQGAFSEILVAGTKKDEIKPVITQMEPKEGGYYSDKVRVNVKAWDDDRIVALELQTSYDGIKWDIQKRLEYTGKPEISVNEHLDLQRLEEGLLYIRAIACDASGNASSQDPTAPFVQIIVDKTPPAAPGLLDVSARDGYIDIKWGAEENTDIAGYDIYRSTQKDTGYTKIQTGLRQANYRDFAVERQKTYYYAIEAVDAAGNRSDRVVTQQPVTIKEDTEAPVIEQLLPEVGSALGAGMRTIRIFARDNAGIASITLEYQDGADGSYQVLEEKKTGQSYNVAWLDFTLPVERFRHGELITVRAKAKDVSGNTGIYKEQRYRADLDAPGLERIQVEYKEEAVVLTWQGKKESDLSGYRVFRRTKETNEWLYVGERGAESEKTNYSLRDTSMSDKGGTYLYRVEAVDKTGNTSRTQSPEINVPALVYRDTTAPDAVLECNAKMEKGVEYLFDASASSDNVGIVSYHWSFGDGAEAATQMAIHKYADTGTYQVELTVADAAGNKKTAQKQITVAQRQVMGTIKAIVKDDNGTPLSGTPVYFDLGEADQTIAYTGFDGSVSLLTSVGVHKVGVYQEGYLPVIKEVAVVSGDVSPVSLIAVKEDLVFGEFNITTMTLEEIVAAGINPADPDNQHLMKINVKVSIGTRTYDMPCIMQPGGEILQGGSMIYNTPEGGQRELQIIIPQVPSGSTNSEAEEGGYSPDNPPPVLGADIPIEATFLKEFFDVKLQIINQASKEFSLLNNEITLNVPEGLTIVDTKDSLKGNTVAVEEIKGSSEPRMFHWILRGDQPGDYQISAQYRAVLSQFQVPIEAVFEPEKPIHVYGSEGLRIVLDIMEDIKDGAMYYNISFQNLDREAVYLPNLRIIDDAGILQAALIEKCRINQYGYMESLGNTQRLKTLNKGETLCHKYVKYGVADAKEEHAFVEKAVKESVEGLDIEVAINIIKEFDAADPFGKLDSVAGSGQSAYDYLTENENYLYWHAFYQNEPNAQERFGVNLFDFRDPVFRLGKGKTEFQMEKSLAGAMVAAILETGFAENTKLELDAVCLEEAGKYVEQAVESIKESALTELQKQEAVECLKECSAQELAGILQYQGYEAMCGKVESLLRREAAAVAKATETAYLREMVHTTWPDAGEQEEALITLLKTGLPMLFEIKAVVQQAENALKMLEPGSKPEIITQIREEFLAGIAKNEKKILDGILETKTFSQHTWTFAELTGSLGGDMQTLLRMDTTAAGQLGNIQLLSYLSNGLQISVKEAYDQYLSTEKIGKSQAAVKAMSGLRYLADTRAYGEAAFLNYISRLQGEQLLERTNVELGTNYTDFAQWYDNAIQVLNTRRGTLLQSGGSGLPLPEIPVVSIDYEESCTKETFGSEYEYSINGEAWITCEGKNITIEPSNFAQTVRVRKKGSAQGFAGNIGSAVIPPKERILANIQIKWSREGYLVSNLQSGKRYQYLVSDQKEIQDPDWSKAEIIIGREGEVLLQADMVHSYLWMRVIPNEGKEGFPSDTRSYQVWKNCTVTLTKEGEGSISGAGEYEYGQMAVVRAEAAEGHLFKGWFEGNQRVSEHAEYQFEVSQNVELCARFEARTKVEIRLALSEAFAGKVYGGGSYYVGDRVTIQAAELPGEGYRFVGWQDEKNNLISPEPVYTFQVKADQTLTAVYRLMTYHVTVNEDDGGSTKGAEQPIVFGKNAVLTAVPDPGYTFGGWMVSGKILSTSPVYTFMVTGDCTVSAKFHKDIINTFKVVFQDINQDVLKTQYVEMGGTATPPESEPSKPGRKFIGWGSGVALPITSDTVFMAQYQFEEKNYKITIENGILTDGGQEKSCHYDERVSVTAEERKNGRLFSCWMAGDEIISYERQYSFQVSGEQHLIAVYKEEPQKPKPLIQIDNSPVVNLGAKKVSFTAKRSLPESYKMVECGLVYTGKAEVANTNLVKGAAGSNFIKSLSQTTNGQYMVTVSGIPAGKSLYAKAYLIYQDEEGSIYTIYTENYVTGIMK